MKTSGITTGKDRPLHEPWYADLNAMHWRILAASFMGWIFDGFETFALIVVIVPMLKSLLAPDQVASFPGWAGLCIGTTLLG
jgi:hypothetical protein